MKNCHVACFLIFIYIILVHVFEDNPNLVNYKIWNVFADILNLLYYYIATQISNSKNQICVWKKSLMKKKQELQVGTQIHGAYI